jgi:hypothetical protein
MVPQKPYSEKIKMNTIENLTEKEFMVERFADLLRHGHYPRFRQNSNQIRMARDPNNQEVLYVASNQFYRDSRELDIFHFDYCGQVRLAPRIPPKVDERIGRFVCVSEGLRADEDKQEGFSQGMDIKTGWKYLIYGKIPINPKVVSILGSFGVPLNVTPEYIEMYEYLNTRKTFLEVHAGHATGIIFLPILPIALPAHYIQKWSQRVKDKFVKRKIEKFERESI